MTCECESTEAVCWQYGVHVEISAKSPQSKFSHRTVHGAWTMRCWKNYHRTSREVHSIGLVYRVTHIGFNNCFPPIKINLFYEYESTEARVLISMVFVWNFQLEVYKAVELINHRGVHGGWTMRWNWKTITELEGRFIASIYSTESRTFGSIIVFIRIKISL